MYIFMYDVYIHTHTYEIKKNRSLIGEGREMGEINSRKGTE